MLFLNHFSKENISSKQCDFKKWYWGGDLILQTVKKIIQLTVQYPPGEELKNSIVLHFISSEYVVMKL